MTQPKERPILFKGEMVNAILDGRKTMTRRILELPNWSTGDWSDFEIEQDGKPAIICKTTGCMPTIPSPYGAVGDRLWVRETTKQHYLPNLLTGEPTNMPCGQYCADNEPVLEEHGFDLSWWYSRPACPAIHMPRWASRITLEITAVRVERLQDISEADAVAEGFKASYSDPYWEGHGRNRDGRRFGFSCGAGEDGKSPAPDDMENAELVPSYLMSSAADAFSGAWYRINGKKYPWASNPWLWCISFKQVQP